MYHIILARDDSNGIGNKGSLPWPRNKRDMEFFREKTTNNIVIMGRKTWESIPEKFRPLPDRINIILSRSEHENTENVHWFTNIIDILRFIDSLKKTEHKDKIPFVIGGAEIYNMFLELQVVSTIWLTTFTQNYECDTFFNVDYLKDFKLDDELIDTKGDFDILSIEKYTYVNKEEKQYLTHVSNILNFGNYRENRTAENTYSLFCPPQLRFNLRNNRFPLLTTKKCVLRQIFVELEFYLAGSADSKKLEEQKVFVWKGNTTREFLDSRGLQHYREGDMGPSYSFNFRHYGAEYTNCDADYTGKGFDQVQYCIDQIKNNPSSRRIIIDLWDCSKMHQMSLPPCMHKYQFYVNDGYLSLHAELRSSDTFLGLPWNIGTAALFLYMMAYSCELKPGDLIMTINDAHIYDNQVNAIKEQLEREPYNFPLLFIKEGTERDLFKFKFSDFELLSYKFYPKLKVPMVV